MGTGAASSAAVAAPNSPSAPSTPPSLTSDVEGSSKDPGFPATHNSPQPAELVNKTTSTPLPLEDAKDVIMPNPSRIKYSPGSVTPPPLSSYLPAPLEAYTPDRGSKLPVDKGEQEDGFLRARHLSLIDSPVLRPPKNASVGMHSEDFPGGTQDTAPMSAKLSPPPHHPSSSYADDNTTVIAVTPAPQRQHPRLAPPSGSQLPSTFLPTSSPAPFWRYLEWDSPANKVEITDLSSPFKFHRSSSPAPHDDYRSRARARELGSPIKGRSKDNSIVSEDLLAEHQPIEHVNDVGVNDLPGIDLTK